MFEDRDLERLVAEPSWVVAQRCEQGATGARGREGAVAYRPACRPTLARLFEHFVVYRMRVCAYICFVPSLPCGQRGLWHPWEGKVRLDEAKCLVGLMPQAISGRVRRTKDTSGVGDPCLGMQAVPRADPVRPEQLDELVDLFRIAGAAPQVAGDLDIHRSRIHGVETEPRHSTAAPVSHGKPRTGAGAQQVLDLSLGG